jgi:hypothetical protein
MRTPICQNRKGAQITAKRVWGIVLIVVGVVFLLGGLTSYYDADNAEKEIRRVRSLTPTLGKGFDSTYSAVLAYTNLPAEISQTKRYSIAGLIVGVALASLGTLMLKETEAPCRPRPRPDFKFRDDKEFDDWAF